MVLQIILPLITFTRSQTQAQSAPLSPKRLEQLSTVVLLYIWFNDSVQRPPCSSTCKHEMPEAGRAAAKTSKIQRKEPSVTSITLITITQHQGERINYCAVMTKNKNIKMHVNTLIKYSLMTTHLIMSKSSLCSQRGSDWVWTRNI